MSGVLWTSARRKLLHANGARATLIEARQRVQRMTTFFHRDRADTAIDGGAVEAARAVVCVEVVADASANLVRAHAARCVLAFRTHFFAFLLLVTARRRQSLDDSGVGGILRVLTSGLTFGSPSHGRAVGRSTAGEQESCG